jgi:hypothetical protein
VHATSYAELDSGKTVPRSSMPVPGILRCQFGPSAVDRWLTKGRDGRRTSLAGKVCVLSEHTLPITLIVAFA